jgi:outer membrane protein TolC
MKPLVISSTFVLLAGCSTIQLPETVNDSHSTAAKQSQQSLVATQWQAPHQAGALQRDLTQVLKTPALNQLIQTALRNNPDLGQSALRLKEQGLLVRQVRAAQLPAISLDGLRTQTGEGSSTTAKSYQIGFSSSWEIDLWGRLADETRTAKLDQAALQADHQAARNSLASQVARHWVSLDAQLAAARQSVANYPASVNHWLVFLPQ